MTATRDPHAAGQALILYSKPDCPLCDEGLETIQRVARHYGLEVQKVNIESDSALREAYGERIPVVVFAGKELSWGRISERALSRKLTGLLES